MSQLNSRTWLHRFAVVTALATLGLIVMGGLVTSRGVGMAVPDWPTSYGYNMFALPVSMWLTGGVFDEHTHRLWASAVGVLVVALARWLGGRKACWPLLAIGFAEVVAGWLLLRLGADWKGAGHFLAGIGGVVLLGGVVWVRNAPAAKPLPALGWAAFVLVQLQGLLGGLRVVLDAHLLGDVRLGTAFGIVHGCLGQAFLVLLCVIALFTSRWWRERRNPPRGETLPTDPRLARWFLVATVLIFLQLLIGATMRHQHAGLAIADFPLAYGRLWPDTSADAVARYNQQRVEITTANAITSFQIWLQMLHRLMAGAVLAAVAFVVWRAQRGSNAAALRRLAGVWLGLIFLQAALGAWTIWSNKAADIATAHVLVGALSLVTGAVGCIISSRRFTGATVAQGAPSPDGPCTTDCAPATVNS
jgi:cytochrome c oxidase assembly protein subunit 15